MRRPFPVQGLSYVDPFLLIDEMGPVQYAPGKAIGAPDHPHRGFETVTYIIDGEMEHEDSHGHRGAIRGGDVQWMTAGAGVIHSEMPSQRMLREGGRMHGFQIWVNLPRSLKLAQPRYQEYGASQLPLIEQPQRWVRIIAGEVDGKRSPIETTVPTTLLHFKLQNNAETSFEVAPQSNAIVHAISGSATIEDKTLHAHEAMLFEPAPQTLHVRAAAEPFEALLLAGVPLREPVARYGPFVMNSVDELQQAFDDFRSGRFGEIART
ncbi:MAG TPA: pirin family protein [Candidatus Baltobacteraceae bacterium]|nr:pirin family protein [Candidatus Baltobacteraceae bacterium]